MSRAEELQRLLAERPGDVIFVAGGELAARAGLPSWAELLRSGLRRVHAPTNTKVRSAGSGERTDCAGALPSTWVYSAAPSTTVSGRSHTPWKCKTLRSSPRSIRSTAGSCHVTAASPGAVSRRVSKRQYQLTLAERAKSLRNEQG